MRDINATTRLTQITRGGVRLDAQARWHLACDRWSTPK